MTNSEWKSFQKSGIYKGNTWDQKDGFIHLSQPHQVERIAKKYFKEARDDLLIIPIREKSISQCLKYEPNSKGDLFPHAYQSIPLSTTKNPIPFKVESFDFSSLK